MNNEDELEETSLNVMNVIALMLSKGMSQEEIKIVNDAFLSWFIATNRIVKSVCGLSD